MVVDEKYVEEVKAEEDFEDILKELGIEASYERNGNGIDLVGYEETYLRDMYPDDLYTGTPILSDIYCVEFEDKSTGETKINWKIDLVLKDDSYPDEKEAYIFPINLKSDETMVKNVHHASGLYALVMGLMELKAKGIHLSYNKLDLVNIPRIQKIVASYNSLTIKVIEREFKGGNPYNAFRIVEGE